MRTPYPGYDVLGKWNSPSYNDQTREVVARRLHNVPRRRFLSEDEWCCLDAISARLVPQPDRAEPVPITPWIDEQLALGLGEGFRHEGMPPLRQAWRKGLAAIDGEARRLHGRGFAELEPEARDATLLAVQKGEVDEELWAGLPAQRFFSDVLLKTVAGLYYTHPAAWNEIGYGGPASPRGYVRLGSNQRDPWEAKEVP
jgi:hypothetical protein